MSGAPELRVSREWDERSHQRVELSSRSLESGIGTGYSGSGPGLVLHLTGAVTLLRCGHGHTGLGVTGSGE